MLFGGGRRVWCGRGSWGWGRIRCGFWRGRLGTWRGGRGVRVLGGLFVGLADGFAPSVGVVGVDVFVLGEGQDLDEGLAEIGEGGGGFGFYVALGDGGEEASEGGGEVAGGHEAAGKVIGDVLAGFPAGEGLRFLAGVEGAEIGIAGLAWKVAAVDEGERTQRGTVLGAIGHGSLQKERFRF